MPYSDSVSPFNAPNYDVFSPARRNDARGVILGAPLDGGQSYVPWIGLSTVRELALKHQVGLVEADEHESVANQLAAATAELEQLRARVAELEANQDRIAGLARAGFKVQKIMGRPKQEDK